ncbi:hypothetical protein HYS93_02425 [Candidatus Daviesbacteria bacterium]|nr:hypothetical protein [Candidatus Daviesbacteria bacterium]
MNTHSCETLIATCIDFRFQEYINDWIKENFSPKTYDRVAFAGGVKEFETIFGQIETSKRLHDIKKVVLINHEDCGAYGESGTKKKHIQDLKQASSRIKKQYSDLEVATYYLKLSGTFEKIQ